MNPALNLPSDRLSQRVAADLAKRIAEGEFDGSDRLPTERSLAEMLSVSRTTVREALLALELSGIIEIRGGSGSYLLKAQDGNIASAQAPRFANSIRESLEIRMILEIQLVAWAAERASEADLDAIKAALDDGWRSFREENFLHNHKGADPKGDPDGRFHVAIARAAGNETSAQLVEELWGVMRTPLSGEAENLVQIEQYAELSLLDHDRILAALIERDPEAASAAMRRHLMRYQKIMGWTDQG